MESVKVLYGRLMHTKEVSPKYFNERVAYRKMDIVKRTTKMIWHQELATVGSHDVS